MNSLKNLVIIAVLTAVGYGVYVSLSKNNVDSGQQSGVAEGWPSMPKVEMPGDKPPALGGPLALSAGPPPSNSGVVATAPPPVAPPLVENQSPPNPVRNITPPPDRPSTDPATNPADSLVQSKYAAFMDEVRKSLDSGRLTEAHLALSKVYGDSYATLPPDMAKQIVTLLDQLAGTIIYSRQHFLEPAYVTQHGDTIGKVADKYNVPWQLLARINGFMPAGASNVDAATKDQPLPVGRVLKVVRGPFDAVVHLDRRELTLIVQNRYAGRFPIGIGRDQPKLEGEYTVCTKTLNPTYYGPDSVTIRPNDPKNPLGGAWIGLTDRIGIHGTNNPQAIGRDDNRGAISTSDRDLQDLYGILTVGSRVTILR